MIKNCFKFHTILCAAIFLVSIFCFGNYADALTATETLNTELETLATRADTLEAEIAKAKADPNTDSVVLEKLLADADVIKNRATEIVGFFTDAPLPPEVKAGPTPAACGGIINLTYKAPASGTVVTYELSRNPYDASLPQASWAWGVVASGTSFDSLPKTQTGLSVGTPYKYQLRAIGKGGVDSFSEIVSIMSSVDCILVATLQATPLVGYVPFDSTLTADNTGTAGGTASYQFKCDSKDATWKSSNTGTPNTYKCIYAVAGTYAPQTQVSKGGKTATANAAVTVNISSYALTVATAGSGAVNSSPAGITCGGDCTESYTSGLSVTLTPYPVSGWKFAGWSGACVNSIGNCVVVMDDKKSVTATFTQLTSSATLSAYNTRGETVDFGATSTLTWTSENANGCRIDSNQTLAGFPRTGLDGNSVSGITVPSLTVDTTFTLTCVPTVGATGNSVDSVLVKVRPMPLSAPSVSASPTAPACGGSINLAYKAPASGTVVSYELSRNPYDASLPQASWAWGVVASGASLDSLPKTQTGLSVGTLYKYQLRAIGKGGVDSFSLPVTINASVACSVTPPPNPEIIYPTSKTSSECGGKIEISWTKADSTKWAGYRIYRFSTDPLVDSSAYQTIVIKDINQTLYTDTAPKPNTPYWYRVETLTANQIIGISPKTQMAGVLLAQAGAGIQSGHSGRIPGLSGVDEGTLSSGSCGPTNLKIVPECYTDRGVKGNGPFHESNFLSWNAVPNASGYYVYRRDVTLSKTASFEKIPLRQCRGLIAVAGCADGLYTQSDGYISKDYEYKVTALVSGKETESSNTVFQEGYADACPGAEKPPVQNPDLTPASNTPTVSNGEADASYVNPDKLTYFIPGKKAKIDGGVLNIGTGVVPAGKHFNVRFQKSSNETFDPANVGVVDVVAPAGNLLKDGKIPVSYNYSSAAGDEGKTYYFRYCVDQPPTDDVGSVVETQSASDASAIPAVGEFNNCSAPVAVKFKTPEKPTCDCNAINSSLTMPPQSALVIAANTPSITGSKDIKSDDASVIKLRWNSTGAESVTLFKVLKDGKTEGGNLIVGNLPKGEISLTNLTVGEYDYVFTATNLGGECVSKVHFNIVPAPLPKPDLIISVSPSANRAVGASGPLYVGEKLIFTARVKNQGGFPVSNTFYNRFQILREDKTVEATVGEPALGSLVVGGTSDVTSSFWTAVAGTYKVVACADSSETPALHNKIDEGDKEGNNCSPSDAAAGGTTIKVEKPDLAPLGALGTNDTGLPNAPVPSGTTFMQGGVTYYKSGTVVKFNVEPKNIGGTFTAPSFNVKLQVKDVAHPDTPSGDAFYVDRGTARISEGIAYDKSKTATIEETSGATETKAFKYRYCIDLPPNENQTDDPGGFGLVAESNENNNCSGLVIIRYGLPNVPPPTLTLKVRKAGVDPYTHDLLTVDDGDRVDLTWDYTGTSACAASWKNPSGISAVDADLSVGPLRRSGSPYTYTVTCGALSDKVTVNVRPPVIIEDPPLSCVLDIRPFKPTGTFGRSVSIFTGEGIQLQWKVTGASSISLYKYILDSKADNNNLVIGNNPNEDVVVNALDVGRYKYKLSASNTTETLGCAVGVQVNPAPKPDLIPFSPLDVYGPKNPDGSVISGEKITLSAVPKNIGGSPAGPFNLRFQYKLSSDPDINHYTPLLKAGAENFARVPNGLGARLTLPTAVGVTHTSNGNETATYDFRYCVDLPQTLSPQNSGIVGNVNEIQVSDAEDRINGIGEYNNCSGAKSVRFAPPPPPADFPSGRISCGTLTSSTIELLYRYSSADKSSLFKDGETVPIQTFTSGGASGSYTDTGLIPGSTHTYRLRNSDVPSSELLGSATCTTRRGSALSVECKVLPDRLDLSSNNLAVWRVDTKGTGVSPYKFKWLSGDGLLGQNPQSVQSNSVYDVTVDYPPNTARNHKTGRIQVEDSARERVDEPQIVTASCGLPGTESPPVSEGSLTASCEVSDPVTDAVTGNQFVTWDAKIINTGIPDYTYVWKIGSSEDVSGRNKPSIKVWAIAGSNPVTFPTGTVTVGDSYYWMRDAYETVEMSCGVDVVNSNDAFTLSVSPRAIMNFVGQKAASSKVAIGINPDFGFESPVTITPSGTVGGVPVTYAFYKRGAMSSVKIPNTVTITREEYTTAGFGIDMVIESDTFISPDRYERAVTVRGDGGGKKDTQFVSVDVNDSRPTFQNF